MVDPSVENIFQVLQKYRKQTKVLAYAKHLYEHVFNNGLDHYKTLGNYIVPMLVECQGMFYAQQAFNRLNHQNVHSWTSLMLGYIQCGRPQHALRLYQKMENDNVHPSTYTVVAALRACARTKDVECGRHIHNVVSKNGYQINAFVGSALVDMYAKCGSLAQAREVFDELPNQDIVTWTAIIAGYVDHGDCQEALQCFDQMQTKKIDPDAVTYVCSLKACVNIRDFGKGRQIHNVIRERGFDTNLFVGSTLVDMYAKCGSLAEACCVFYKLPLRDIVSWNALIAGYAEIGPALEALKCFQQMQQEGISPDAITFILMLKVCASIGAIDKGRELHIRIKKMGLERELFVGNSLIDMYTKCGSIVDAREVFNKLQTRDVVSWTTLVAGYADQGSGQEALKCFEEMQLRNVSPNAIAFVCSLKACGIIRAIDKGRQLHAQIAQMGFESDLFVGTSLVDMYAKCGSLAEAQHVFDKLAVRNVVSWTALIGGYAEHGPYEEAVRCFEQMQLEGECPNIVTFVCSLKACSNIGAVQKGREIHTQMAKKGLDKDLFVGSTLIDMYAKCGWLLEARKVFDKLSDQDAVTWNAMIRGYGMNHEGSMAIQCFKNMQEVGVKPDVFTFTCLLTACSRASLVVKGLECFKVMEQEYGIAAESDHYTCIVDLLARSGHLYEAEKLLQALSKSVSLETMTALLSACKTYGEEELGVKCFQQLLNTSPESAASNVLMSNIYAFCDNLDDAAKIEQLRRHASQAASPIEVDNNVHELVIGNQPSEEILEALQMLSTCMKEGSYVPNLHLVGRPIADEEKVDLCGHENWPSPLGFCRPQGQTLHVMKKFEHVQ